MQGHPFPPGVGTGQATPASVNVNVSAGLKMPIFVFMRMLSGREGNIDLVCLPSDSHRI